MLAKFDLGCLDLIVVEGFKHAAYPKIEVHRAALGRPPLYPDDPDIIAVVGDAPVPPGAGPRALPLDDPGAVAAFILERLDTGLLWLGTA
jgi:molybdopterin-guanine dinucleotide biosynthesis adapter protein